jgi:hypothetical protein
MDMAIINLWPKNYKLFFLNLLILVSVDLLGARKTKTNNTKSNPVPVVIAPGLKPIPIYRPPVRKPVVKSKFINMELDSIVTNDILGGRLGDQLISYLHAKWVSYKYDLPFYYKSFIYSEQLVLDDLELRYDPSLANERQIKKMVYGQTLEQFLATGKKGMLYDIPYFPESIEELQPAKKPDNYNHWQRLSEYYPFFPVDWSDPEFKKIIQKMIAPKKQLNLVKLPKNRLTVALQVRKNSGGFDLPLLHGLSDQAYNPKTVYTDVVFPFKHPPEEYFIEQLKYVIKRFSGQKLFVFMFTDDPTPKPILERIKQAINDPRIEFDCRTAENNHYSNVLEDLFSIAQFDCFIRPDSNLGIVASKLGNFKMVISPAHHHWKKRNLIIDKVEIQVSHK